MTPPRSIQRKEAFQLLLAECQQLITEYDVRLEKLREQAGRVIQERDRVLSTVMTINALLGRK